MGSAARAPAASHPLESGTREERSVQACKPSDHMPPVQSPVPDADAKRILGHVMDPHAWSILQRLEVHDEAVHVLAHTVHELVCMVHRSASAAPAEISTSLQEAMADEWDMPSCHVHSSPAAPGAAASEALEGRVHAAAWLRYLAQGSLVPPDRNQTPSPRSSDVASETSHASSTSAQPMAPVVELTHMVPMQARPPPQLPRGYEQGIHVDRYGFVCTASSPAAAERDGYEAQQAACKAQWDAYLATQHTNAETQWQDLFQFLRQQDGSTAAGQSAWRSFQRLCEQGIPMCYRPAVWSECVQASALVEPGRYQELAAATTPFACQIALDAHRTMPNNCFFGGKGPGVKKLQHVLEAWCAYNPEQGYCQGMNNLAAILLLTYTHEEDAFWAMLGMIQHILPNDFYARSMRVPQADQRVLQSLVRAGLPKLHAHFQAHHVELAAVTYAWFLSLFTVCLPIETLFRVWDTLLVEGSITLFRVAYAILAHTAPALLAAPTAAAVYDVLHQAAAQWVDAERLIQTCRYLRGTIRASDVAARRARALSRTCTADIRALEAMARHEYE